MAGKQIISRRKQLEKLLGQEINVVFLLKESGVKKQNEFYTGGIIEKRENKGYYLIGTNMQLPLKHTIFHSRQYPENTIVVKTQYSPSTLNSLLSIK